MVAVTTFAAPAFAVDTTLDFSGNICGATGTGACGDGTAIGQTYGDIAGQLEVSYRSINNTTGVTYEAFLKHWGDNYSDLEDVAWGGGNATNYRSEITFDALAGYSVTLASLDFGDYLNRNFGSSFAINELGTNTLLYSSGPFNPGATATHFAPDKSSSLGLVLTWGPDGYDVGVDNIMLSVSPTAVIPEPETYALLLAGLGLMGFVARRRRATSTATARR
jgi:hypothetical protein